MITDVFMRHKMAMLGAVGVLALLAVMIIMAPKASAFSRNYYDWQDTGSGCDLASSDCGTRVQLMAGETRFVRDTGVQVQVYFTQPTGQLIVNNVNFCPGNGGDELQSGDYFGPDSGRSLNDDTVVTDVTVRRGSNNAVVASGVGRYNYQCNQALTINLDASDFERHPNLPGLYYVNVDIEHRDKRVGQCQGGDTSDCDGIKNAFLLRIAGTYAYQIAQKAGNGRNNQVTLQQGSNFSTNRHLDYRIRFGAACEVLTTATATLRIYDLDAGGGSGGAQVGPLTMRLIHISPTGVRTVQELPVEDAANRSREYNFTARRNYNYIWEINNVYWNNTIQLSTPYDGIYFTRECPNPRMTCGFPDAIGTIESQTQTNSQMQGGWTGDQPARASRLNYWVLNSSGIRVANGGETIPPLVRASFRIPITIPPLPAGQYQLMGEHLAGDPQGTRGDCSQPFRVADKPYFKVYNGDARAGGGFTAVSACTALGPGNIRAFSTGNVGAGSQIAAFASGLIDGFTSATMRGSAPLPVKGLTFANMGAGNAGTTYGGSYGDGGACMPDYFALKPAAAPVITAATPYSVPGNNAFSGKDDIYVNGDAYIASNIIYTSTGWADISTIPSFRLIVRGNIYIHYNVGQLDGTYIAVPSGPSSGGTIYTCVAVAGVPPTVLQMANECRRRLVVNGSFIARQVKLLRTNNTRAQASPGETRPGNAAEVFNFTPAVWMAQPEYPLPPGQSYDAITNMPPVL